MKRIIVPSLVLLSLIGAASAQQVSDSISPPRETKLCESCHGPNGNGTVSTTPRLNGQNAPYILIRLQDFTDLMRETPHASSSMLQVVTNMPDRDKESLATYFSSQAPTTPYPGALAPQGRRIYENGDPSSNVPACQSCHGPQGAGRGSIPRIARQHADYLTAELVAFNLQVRENRVMHANANNLSAEQIDALVSYLANN